MSLRASALRYAADVHLILCGGAVLAGDKHWLTRVCSKGDTGCRDLL